MASKTQTLVVAELIQRRGEDPAHPGHIEGEAVLVPADPTAGPNGGTVRLHVPQLADLAELEVGKAYNITITEATQEGA